MSNLGWRELPLRNQAVNGPDGTSTACRQWKRGKRRFANSTALGRILCALMAPAAVISTPSFIGPVRAQQQSGSGGAGGAEGTPPSHFDAKGNPGGQGSGASAMSGGGGGGGGAGGAAGGITLAITLPPEGAALVVKVQEARMAVKRAPTVSLDI